MFFVSWPVRNSLRNPREFTLAATLRPYCSEPCLIHIFQGRYFFWILS